MDSQALQNPPFWEGLRLQAHYFMSRVQLICLSNYEGGMEKHVADLAAGLARRGHVVGIICGKGFSQHIIPEAEIFEVDAQKSRINPGLLLTVFKTIRNFQPDVIHCHGGKAALIIGLIPVNKDTTKVCTIHGLKSVNSAYNPFDLRIGVSKAITASVLTGGRKCITVYNGLDRTYSPADESDFNIRECKLPPQFTWVAVGRLVKVKGFDLAIKALAQTNHNLIIAGAGPEREELENLTANYHLKDRVKFLGHRSDIAKIYGEVDGTLITSVREGFSYVFLESMIAGTPVIATDVPVANEILPERYICRNRSPETLAMVMKSFAKASVSEKAQCDEMLFCQQELTLEKMISKTEEAYLKAKEKLTNS